MATDDWPHFRDVRTVTELGRRIGMLERTIRRRYRLDAAPPLHHDPAGLAYIPRAEMWALLATDLGGGNYSYAERVPAGSGTWTAPAGARSGSDAYEANGVTGLAGSVVRLRMSEAGDWRFQCDECEDGGCDGQLCMTVSGCDGFRVEGATVTVKTSPGGIIVGTCETNALGQCCIGGLDPGDYTWTVEADGLESEEDQPFTIDAECTLVDEGAALELPSGYQCNCDCANGIPETLYLSGVGAASATLTYQGFGIWEGCGLLTKPGSQCVVTPGGFCTTTTDDQQVPIFYRFGVGSDTCGLEAWAPTATFFGTDRFFVDGSGCAGSTDLPPFCTARGTSGGFMTVNSIQCNPFVYTGSSFDYSLGTYISDIVSDPITISE